ncbi:receptor-type tyrosine-protein phosphatase C-like [Gigantopelta aegis]|uniref:receptor-type tyrosine-protein phosphatase C-like n=1 Tax=Gigantopelta aegis TaxID=1735272 RepID=UPI001B8894C5|nr:receptor-type tyrosine-protein phosphatase C-like [Gigantopelta aegis]
MTNDIVEQNGSLGSKQNTFPNITVPYAADDVGFDMNYLYWIFLCILMTIFGLCLASCKYLRDQYHNPELKRKRKEKYEVETRAKEEKAVLSVTPEPIPSYRFLHTLYKKKSDKQLNIEVRAIVHNQEEFPCTTALLPRNAANNNKPEIITYDHSRVILRDMPPGYNNDYINASFIDGYTLTKEYIATQGECIY